MICSGCGKEKRGIKCEHCSHQDDEPKQPGTPTAPVAVAIADVNGQIEILRQHFEDTFAEFLAKHERLVDHVNNELGVADDVSIIGKIRDLQSRVAKLEEPVWNPKSSEPVVPTAADLDATVAMQNEEQAAKDATNGPVSE